MTQADTGLEAQVSVMGPEYGHQLHLDHAALGHSRFQALMKLTDQMITHTPECKTRFHMQDIL